MSASLRDVVAEIRTQPGPKCTTGRLIAGTPIEQDLFDLRHEGVEYSVLVIALAKMTPPIDVAAQSLSRHLSRKCKCV